MYDMPKLLFTTTAGLLVLGLAATAPAQEKRVSPHETTSIEVGGHKISITYGRPSLRGRKMLGAHEPYGKVWRTGADEATVLETDADLDINGLKVPKGSYALFTIPGEKSWTLIINKTAKQWGAFNYKEAADLGRVPMNVSKPASSIEEFTIKLAPAGTNACTLTLEWENTEASVPVKVAS
jgi:hypothetical protein